jgi:F0F1-type ATP synthase membrane subunit c/vacuolar-type H+-ATPase subunit K
VAFAVFAGTTRATGHQFGTYVTYNLVSDQPAKRVEPRPDVWLSTNPAIRSRTISPMARSKPLIILAIVAGLALIAVAGYYWATPAGSLPSWFPGHVAGSSHHHLKHGIAALLVGLACLVYAWFATGKRPEAEKESAT